MRTGVARVGFLLFSAVRIRFFAAVFFACLLVFFSVVLVDGSLSVSFYVLT